MIGLSCGYSKLPSYIVCSDSAKTNTVWSLTVQLKSSSQGTMQSIESTCSEPTPLTLLQKGRGKGDSRVFSRVIWYTLQRYIQPEQTVLYFFFHKIFCDNTVLKYLISYSGPKLEEKRSLPLAVLSGRYAVFWRFANRLPQMKIVGQPRLVGEGKEIKIN